MELWQMDIVGGVVIAEQSTGELSEAKVITGIDDHSRFCVCTRVVPRATARPVCDALELALARHGCPDQILSDNGKVFTNRFGKGAAWCSLTGYATTTPSSISSPSPVRRPPLERWSVSTKPFGTSS